MRRSGPGSEEGRPFRIWRDTGQEFQRDEVGESAQPPSGLLSFRFHHVRSPTTSQALYVGAVDIHTPANNKNPWALALWILQPSTFSFNFLILKPRERNSHRPHGPSHNPAACPRRTVTPGLAGSSTLCLTSCRCFGPLLVRTACHLALGVRQKSHLPEACRARVLPTASQPTGSGREAVRHRHPQQHCKLSCC